MNQKELLFSQIFLISIPIMAVIGIILKLSSIITWSWWVVLIPIYVPIIYTLAALILLIVIHSSITKHGK